MTEGKPIHLIERAAKRLLQSGALEDSAAQMLDAEGKVNRVPVPSPASSSLFRSPVIAEPEPEPPQEAQPEPHDHPSTIRHDADGRPVLDVARMARSGLVDWSSLRSRVSEEFRLVQRQILRTAFLGQSAEPGFTNLLMVTSAKPGEGKSFTALNLAASIARQGDNNVLLVDSDTKRDSLTHSMGLADRPGLLDLALNPRDDPAQFVLQSAIERLAFLPVGLERQRGPELFAGKEMGRLIQSLGRRYADRLIILDAPPALSTSDPAVLAPVVGQVLFVVEAERTQRDEVEASLDLIQACPTITLILNKVQITTRYSFGAYSAYYYNS
jgi:receptor protein-tyrosine kinase